MMLVKQDSCRLNNSESFLYNVSCNVDIVKFNIFIGRGIPPDMHANFCHLSLFFLLSIFIEFIYKFLMVFYYTHVSKRHFLNDG